MLTNGESGVEGGAFECWGEFCVCGGDEWGGVISRLTSCRFSLAVARGRSLGRGLEKRGEGEREGLKEATEEPRGERPPSDSPPPSTPLGTKGGGRRKGRAGENWGASAGGRQEA